MGPSYLLTTLNYVGAVKRAVVSAPSLTHPESISGSPAPKSPCTSVPGGEEDSLKECEVIGSRRICHPGWSGCLTLAFNGDKACWSRGGNQRSYTSPLEFHELYISVRAALPPRWCLTQECEVVPNPGEE